VFEILRKNGLKLNATKSRFFRRTTDHLGFDLEPGIIKKQSKKILKFLEYVEKHTNKKTGKFELKNANEVLELIGLTGLYRRFIPCYQQILRNLYKLTEKGEVFVWGPDQEEAFEKLRAEYIKDFVLISPRKGYDLYLDTYTSSDAMNAVLYQTVEGQDEIVMFTSFSFKEHQKSYTLIEREMYNLTKTIRKLQLWLHGRTIHVRSDLKSIVANFEVMAEIHRKAAIWITQLNCYNLIYDLRKKHKRWFGIQAPEITLNYCNFANLVSIEQNVGDKIRERLISSLRKIDQFQKKDKTCKGITYRLKVPDERLNQRDLEAKKRLAMRFSIHTQNGKEILMFNNKDETVVPVLPDELFTDTMTHLHEVFGHVGANKLDTLFRRMYYSANSKHYVRYLTSACLYCKANKNYGMKKPIEFAYVNAYRLADVLSVDLLGPIANESDEPKYVFVAKDVFSGKIWLRLLISIKQKAVADTMEEVIEEIITLGHKIRKVNTDNAVQFKNNIWKKLLKRYRIQNGKSTPYNPQSNIVERTMRLIGEHLRVKINLDSDGAYTHHGWHQHIKTIENEINHRPNEVEIIPDELWQLPGFETGLPVNYVPINAKFELKATRRKIKEKILPS
ncbi:unnamed protein product, partial [Allacma fusca]